MKKDDLRDLTEQVLFETKMEENGLFSSGKSDEKPIPFRDLGFYRASIPLIETGGILFIGVLTSFIQMKRKRPYASNNQINIHPSRVFIVRHPLPD